MVREQNVEIERKEYANRGTKEPGYDEQDRPIDFPNPRQLLRKIESCRAKGDDPGWFALIRLKEATPKTRLRSLASFNPARPMLSIYGDCARAVSPLKSYLGDFDQQSG